MLMDTACSMQAVSKHCAANWSNCPQEEDGPYLPDALAHGRGLPEPARLGGLLVRQVVRTLHVLTEKAAFLLCLLPVLDCVSPYLCPNWACMDLEPHHWPSWMLQYYWKLISRHLRQGENKHTWGDDHDINAKGLELASETLRHCVEAGLAGGVGGLHTLASHVIAVLQCFEGDWRSRKLNSHSGLSTPNRRAS